LRPSILVTARSLKGSDRTHRRANILREGGVVFCDTSGRFSFDDQLLQSGFDHGDLFVDLTDWQAEVVPRSCPGPELERKPLPMLPEIVKRATVLMPDLQLND
jgi:hypothetical protein